MAREPPHRDARKTPNEDLLGIFGRMERQLVERAACSAVEGGFEMSGTLHATSKVDEKHAKRWADQLRPHLFPGEALVMLSKTSHAKPMANALALTTTRLMAFDSSGGGSTPGPRIEMMLADARAAEMRSRMGSKTLHLVSADGEDISFGAISAADADEVLKDVQQAIEQGPDVEVHDRVEAEQQQTTDAWAKTLLVGKKTSRKARKVIEEHCSPGEAPWFILHSAAGSGVLAAFSDRCMIIKTGGMTSMMAGSFGGSRISTFPYQEVTAVEYNSGMINGVLEVLTASYQGTANKDFWRGALSSPNANANNPYALSNTLPLSKREYAAALNPLNEMRKMITERRQVPPSSTVPPAPLPKSNGLAEELSELVDLHSSGALTDEEFTAAKKQAIGRHRS
ncbi:SHOCT domain-containing protein [Streptomyces sp. NPDC000151]|uniref:SHOCT domain-containing protein n=1 Tax=Streptomyces sp. NPDC000151 TaxID=3154244 RepID=UPI00331BA99A